MYVESEDDVATDLTPVKNKTFDEESRSQMSPEPPTEGTNADEGFGAGSESDPFTDKMVSGDSEPFIRPITAVLKTFAVFYCHADHILELLKNVRSLSALAVIPRIPACKLSVCLQMTNKKNSIRKLRHFSLLLLSDQHDCSPLHCDVNAQCQLNAGTLACRCLGGFTGDGQVCVGECMISCRLSNFQHFYILVYS